MNMLNCGVRRSFLSAFALLIAVLPVTSRTNFILMSIGALYIHLELFLFQLPDSLAKTHYVYDYLTF